MGLHSQSNLTSAASKYQVGQNIMFETTFERQMLNILSIGAVLYTSYLQSLGALHQPSSKSSQRTYPPPPPQSTLMAGFIAGAAQSVVAAPLDA